MSDYEPAKIEARWQQEWERQGAFRRNVDRAQQATDDAVLDRGGADPAIATGPFVTTLVDLIGIVIYFNVARTLLGL